MRDFYDSINELDKLERQHGNAARWTDLLLKAFDGLSQSGVAVEKISDTSLRVLVLHRSGRVSIDSYRVDVDDHRYDLIVHHDVDSGRAIELLRAQVTASGLLPEEWKPSPGYPTPSLGHGQHVPVIAAHLATVIAGARLLPK